MRSFQAEDPDEANIAKKDYDAEGAGWRQERDLLGDRAVPASAY